MNTPIRLVVLLFFIGLSTSLLAQRPIEVNRSRQARTTVEAAADPSRRPATPMQDDEAVRRRPPQSPGVRGFREFMERELRAGLGNTNSAMLQTAIIHRVCEIAARAEPLPKPTGLPRDPRLAPSLLEVEARLKRWLARHSESVSAVAPGPFNQLAFEGYCTRRGNTLYLHVFRWPAQGLRLEGLQSQARGAKVLDSREPLVVQSLRGLGSSRPDSVLIGTPRKTNAIVTVVKVRLAGPPEISGAMASTWP